MANKHPFLSIDMLEDQAQAFYNALSSETHDMPCVLLSIAYLDQCLRSLLKTFFIDGQTSASLLNHKGALGTFDTRADLAYCLGLISKGLLQNLQTLGGMRNQFAHSFLTLSFEDLEVAEYCEKLTMPNVIGKSQDPETGEFHDVTNWPLFTNTPRMRFTVIVSLIANQLLIAVHTTEKRKPKLNGWTPNIDPPGLMTG